MSMKIRWGVIGSGGIARRRTIPEGIVPAENAELATVFDIDAATNAEIASEFKAKAAADIEGLLASNIDAVYIATPVHLHHAQALACAEAGKHVLCEKPLAINPKSAASMIAAFKERGLEIGCAFMMRFQAQHQAARALIEQGKLGTPTYARAQLSCWYPPLEGAWRQDPELGGGGSLMDLGGHCIDLLEMFFGPVQRVSCFTNRSVHAYRSEDSAVAMLGFRNGAIGTVDTFFCIPDAGSKNALELYGSRGSILATGTIGQGALGTMTAYLESEDAGYDAQQERAGDSGRAIEPAPVNPYQAEIEEFSQALLDGRSPALNAEMGLRSQRVLTACYEAARTGQTIGID